MAANLFKYAQNPKSCLTIANVKYKNPFFLLILEMILSASSVEEAKKVIKKAIEEKDKLIILRAGDNEFNRKMLEYGRFDILLSVESGVRKDSLKQLDSGLNHVLAEIAAKNNIAVGVDMEEIRKLKKKDKAICLARISQNISLCRKTKTKIKIVNIIDKLNSFSLLLSLGASTMQAEEAVDF